MAVEGGVSVVELVWPYGLIRPYPGGPAGWSKSRHLGRRRSTRPLNAASDTELAANHGELNAVERNG
jgi:hypothetical protein